MKKVFYISILMSLLLVGSLEITNAQNEPQQNSRDYTLLAPLSTEGFDVEQETYNASNVSLYVRRLVQIIIGLASVLAVLTLVYGGFKYIAADSFTGKSSGKETVQRALWGLLLILGAVIILQTINPNILNINRLLTDISQKPAATTPTPQ
jgi:hypothetical protein